MPGQPLIQTSTTSQYNPVFSDRHMHSNMNASFWRPDPNDNAFSILGDYCQNGYNEPNTAITIISVTNDDPGNPILVPPLTYHLVWDDYHGNNTKGNPASIWYPVAPNGYVSIGCVADLAMPEGGQNQPTSITNYVCIRQDYATPGKIGALIWKDAGSGSRYDASMWQITDINGNYTGFFYAQPGYSTPVAQVYTLKEQ